MLNTGNVLIVGGYGIVGGQICTLLAKRHPHLHLLIGGRSLDKAQKTARALPNATGVHLDVEDTDPLEHLPIQPDAIVVSVNDHHDRLLLSATRRGIALIDLARWQERQDDANRILHGVSLSSPVVLASGWMASIAAIVAAAYRQSAHPARRIDIDVLFSSADKAGPDSVTSFVDMHKPFTIYEAGQECIVRGMADPKPVRFSHGRVINVRRFSSPDQTTLVKTGHAESVSARMAFDNTATTAAFALFARSGIWGMLSVAKRRALLYRPGQGASHEFILEIVEDTGTKKISVKDRLGQTHMTAISAANQVERVLALNNRLSPAPGVTYPEQSADLSADIDTIREMGLQIEHHNPS
ncbi:saccharopine dehydrogenase [Pectobacterium aroidearum]|uniref:Saccharopine dehydrogenase n=1 Tax=Pectobacterium aroidearum TaxID=1201031 RepID=A0AAW3SXF4_9GAMM|nr:saccharopine dehydrogenase [Pectobacterium aroidearum]MBA5204339.1 saccharopine dehydrogenase [Pectobacterium aroidearum]